MTSYKFGDENIVHLSVKGLGGGSTDDGMKIIIIIIITFHLCHASYYQLLTIIIYIAESSDTEVITECVSCGGETDLFFCQECESCRCKACNELWHKHLKRKSHTVKVRNILMV